MGHNHVFAVLSEMRPRIVQAPGEQIIPGHNKQIIIDVTVVDTKLDVAYGSQAIGFACCSIVYDL